MFSYPTCDNVKESIKERTNSEQTVTVFAYCLLTCPTFKSFRRGNPIIKTWTFSIEEKWVDRDTKQKTSTKKKLRAWIKPPNVWCTAVQHLAHPEIFCDANYEGYPAPVTNNTGPERQRQRKKESTGPKRVTCLFYHLKRKTAITLRPKTVAIQNSKISLFGTSIFFHTHSWGPHQFWFLAGLKKGRLMFFAFLFLGWCMSRCSHWNVRCERRPSIFLWHTVKNDKISFGVE